MLIRVSNIADVLLQFMLKLAVDTIKKVKQVIKITQSLKKYIMNIMQLKKLPRCWAMLPKHNKITLVNGNIALTDMRI